MNHPGNLEGLEMIDEKLSEELEDIIKDQLVSVRRAKLLKYLGKLMEDQHGKE